MAIKVKAVERNVSFDKNSEKWAFVLQADLYSKLSQTKVIQEAALRSGISKGAINAAWDAIGEVIKAWATEGHSVAVPGLGSMRFGLRSTSVGDVNKVGAGLITSRRVIFTPSIDIKKELADTSINITCYDRYGNVVKRVTSTDDAEVEDPDDDNPSGGNNAPSTGSGTEGPSGGSGTDGGGNNIPSNPSGGNDNPSTGSGTTDGGGSDSTELEQIFIGTSVNDSRMGSVSGMGTYDKGTTVTLKATANAGYRFVSWGDDVTENPRVIKAEVNGATYSAIFEAVA